MRLIAHRGASAYAPANTPEAVTAAATHGATDVEVDVHQTADGHLVVTHDTVHGDRFVSEMTLAELAGVRADHDRDPTPFDHILDAAAAAGLGVYLDVKQLLPGGIEHLASSIEAAGLRERAVFASFRADLALEAKRATGLTTSVLFHDPGLDLNSLVRCTGCDFVHPCFDVFPDPLAHVSPPWLERARRTGAGIIAWNTTTAEMADALIALGVDGICADDPVIIVEALARRATPPPCG